jgi:PEP-CTERM motif
MKKTEILAAVVSISTVLAFTNKAFAFTFTKIADSNNTYSSFTPPTINDDGNVLFQADLTEGTSGIFIGNGININTIANSNGYNSFGQLPGMNDKGAVVFKANANGGNPGIFLAKDGNITSIVEGATYFSLGDPVVNNQGVIAFSGRINGVSGIFTNQGGSIKSVADTSGIYSIFDSPSINQTGNIAFAASLAAGGRGIYATDNQGKANTVVDTSGEFDFLLNPAINNTGTVTFKGVLDALAGEGIYTANSGFTTKVVDNSDRFDFFDNSAINDAGKVAFKGVLKAGGLGIYTGGNPDQDKVIAAGDSLFGSTVTDLYISNKSLNNKNQLVFYAKLKDGSSGIFRADPDVIDGPKTIPEPGSCLGILALGGLGLGFKRQNRKAV